MIALISKFLCYSPIVSIVDGCLKWPSSLLTF
ncbi:hypothetical protein M3J09_002495 [Ascochyta lentis]